MSDKKIVMNEKKIMFAFLTVDACIYEIVDILDSHFDL